MYPQSAYPSFYNLIPFSESFTLILSNLVPLTKMSSIFWLWSRSPYVPTHTSLLYQTISPFLFLVMFFSLLFWCSVYCGLYITFVVLDEKLGLWQNCLDKSVWTCLRIYSVTQNNWVWVCAELMDVAGFINVLHVPLKPPELLGSSKQPGPE